MPSITPFLWLDNNVRDAVDFYQSVFPNAEIETVSDFMASFELEGQRFYALNGGPQLQVQRGGVVLHQRRDPGAGRLLLEQADRWRPGIALRLAQGKFGLSWQVVPLRSAATSATPTARPPTA